MKKSKVVEHFGGSSKVAEVLNISPSSVSEWGEDIPKLRAYQLERITKGALVVEDQDFKKAS